jgi:hypothetical protein
MDVENDTMIRLKLVRLLKLLFPAMLITALGAVLYIAIERGAVPVNKSASASSSVSPKPLIDMQVSKETATATFAMG